LPSPICVRTARIPLEELISDPSLSPGVVENARLYFTDQVDYAERTGNRNLAHRVIHDAEMIPGRTTQHEISLLGFSLDGPIARGSVIEECYDADSVPHVLKPLGSGREGESARTVARLEA
jgi:serine/threonine protein kinase